MAGMGPPPKEGGKQGRYRSPLEEGAVEIPVDGPAEAPQLPYYREYGFQTKRWWDTWKDCPQAQAFTATDWQRLLMLAPLVEQYYAMAGKPQTVRSAILLLTEIRQNESLLGATHLDRLRGRIKIDREPSASAEAEEEEATPAGVAIMANYRKELGA